MQPSISQLCTLSTPIEAEFKAYARGGWGFCEVWLTKLETCIKERSIAELRAIFDEYGIKPISAACQPGLLVARGDEERAHWSDFERRLALMAEFAIDLLVITPDFVAPLRDDDPGRAIAKLAEATALAETFGIRLALEFQKGSRLLASLDTAVAFAAEVGSPRLGICFDLFHYYCGPSKPEDLGLLNRDNLFLVHVSDMLGPPRELATDADRILPGEGVIDCSAILGHFRDIGFAGPVTLELANPGLWRIPAEQLADFGRQAIDRVSRPPAMEERRRKVAEGGR